MEKIYGCGDLDYTSDPICLRDFFNDASLQHDPFIHGPVMHSIPRKRTRDRENLDRERIMEMMDSTLTDSEFLDLENICSASNFREEGGNLAALQDFEVVRYRTNTFERRDVPKDSKLKTHEKLNSRARIHERFLKYVGTIWLDKIGPMDTSKSANTDDVDLIPGNDLLIVVRVYAPFRHNIGKRNHKVAAGCQEIVLLGSQTLTDLRDIISCTSDIVICQDLSANPHRKSANFAKDKYKSSMMFIDKTFYNDMRVQSNVDYSEVVLEWAKQRNLDLGRKAKMEDTKLFDLTVKLGYPYLFQHQGNCEHLFCFSDIRLLHQSDPLLSSKYPFLKSICRKHSRYCMLCGHYIAKWITVGNSRVPHDPCYFCEICFHSYNYINKKKIGDFAAYPFSDASPDFIGNII